MEYQRDVKCKISEYSLLIRLSIAEARLVIAYMQSSRARGRNNAFEVLDNLWNFISFFRKKVKYGNRFHVKGRIFVHGKKAGIVIGDDVTIYSVPTKNPTSGFQHTYLRSEGKGSIVVGNRVGMSHVNITSFNNVTIEDDVLIGSGVKIWDTDFHSVDYENRMVNKNAKSAPIKIKKGAFIGGVQLFLKE